MKRLIIILTLMSARFVNGADQQRTKLQVRLVLATMRKNMDYVLLVCAKREAAEEKMEAAEGRGCWGRLFDKKIKEAKKKYKKANEEVKKMENQLKILKNKDLVI